MRTTYAEPMAEDQDGRAAPCMAPPPLSGRARRAGAAYAGPGAGPAGAVPEPGQPIAFTAGLPDAELLPAAELAEALEAVLSQTAEPALQYGGAQGWLGLREWLAEHCRDRAQLPLSPEHFCLTNGSAGALANVCETFLDPGDVAGVESLSFPLSVRTIRSITPRVVSIPVDAQGIDPDALERLLVELRGSGETMRLLYVIPTFQNPTGSTLPLERRARLVELCRTHGVLIVEDDAYAELWFDQAPPPSLYSLAGGVGVVKIGTFSKIVAPGLRVGWCQAHPSVIAALVATRSDMGTSPLLLRALGSLGWSGFLEEHIARARRVYAAKCDLALRALAAHCSRFCRWSPPEGGFFIWVEAGADLDPFALAAAARDEGVSFVGGHVFSADQAMVEGPRVAWAPGDSRALRLAFSSVPAAEIGEGVRRLGRALTEATLGHKVTRR
jgi:2-aminoadipate transaminase